MSGEVEIALHKQKFRENTEHSKMFMLEPISRGLGNQVPEGLSERFPEHRPRTCRACLN